MPNCTYCGAADGNNRDHVVPAAYAQNAKHFHTETVPACHECNTLLGSRLFVTIPTRAAYLLGAYERRYKKLLSTPAWTDEELNDLGPSLRDSIVAAEAQRKTVAIRIEHLNYVARH